MRTPSSAPSPANSARSERAWLALHPPPESGRLPVVAFALAAVVHLALIGRSDANAGDAVVVALGWMLILLRIAGDGCRPSGCDLSALAGFSLLIFGLVEAAQSGETNSRLLLIVPFLLFVGLLLMSHGSGGLSRHWHLLVILVLMIPVPSPDPRSNPHDFLTLVHANAAGFLLHYIGYDVTIHGLILALPSGAVDVYPGCSGRSLMVLLLKISVVISFGLRVPWRRQLLMCGGAIAAGFIAGVIRIAVMAASVPDPRRFAWLHGPAGSGLFATVGFLLFAPLLIPAERPLADSLRAAWERWKSAAPGPARFLRLSIAGLLVFLFAFYLRGLAPWRKALSRPNRPAVKLVLNHRFGSGQHSPGVERWVKRFFE